VLINTLAVKVHGKLRFHASSSFLYVSQIAQNLAGGDAL
jgi:hypothetical protein